MKKILVINAFLFLAMCSIAQDTTLTFYFRSGQSKLNKNQSKVIAQLHTRSISKIEVFGYADTVGRKPGNKRLSFKRAKTLAAAFGTCQKLVEGKGEYFEKGLSLNKMRKVVVSVWYQQVSSGHIVCGGVRDNEMGGKEHVPNRPTLDTCGRDTTLYFPSGSMVKINRCFYLQQKNCFSYTDYLDARSAQRGGFSTVDMDGNAIVSGGMIDVRFCSDSVLKRPFYAFLPVPPCLEKQAMTMWTSTKGNQWKDKATPVDMVKIDGRLFYKVPIVISGCINCDMVARKPPVLKIKLKNGLRIKKAVLSYDCPIYSLTGKIKRSKKKAVFPYLCPNTEPLIYIKAYNKKGDSLLIDNANINQYQRKRKLISNCACYTQAKERYAGIFKIRRKYLYRKYKFYAKDFTLK
ncbi:MAG: hypothetical protein IT236_17370 [Bacteroidia bacterium]|nr:hypothetical protein [Bacteroidia bacterium]